MKKMLIALLAVALTASFAEANYRSRHVTRHVERGFGARRAVVRTAIPVVPVTAASSFQQTTKTTTSKTTQSATPVLPVVPVTPLKP